MTENETTLPPRLQEIVNEFSTLDKTEKLDLLLEYSEQLPDLPERFRTNDQPLESVDECATPVAIASERDGDQIVFHFDIPPESPTVRGFAAILRDGLAGLTPQAVLSLPGDFYYSMGLQNVLSPQRLNGIYFMLLHIKRVAARELA